MQTIKPHNPAKAYLQRYRALRARYASLIRETTDLRASLTGITAPIRDMPGGGTAGDRMADVVAQIADIEATVADVLAEVNRALQDVIAAIDAVPDETQRAVLTMRYIEGMDWLSIQGRLNYEKTQIFVIHGRALVAVNEWMAANNVQPSYETQKQNGE